MENNQLNTLKDILLDEERFSRNELGERVDVLDEQLNNTDELRKKLKPILVDQVTYLRKNFPNLFGEVMVDSIKTQIRDSQDEMVDALYPIMGKMIKKYIAMEMRLLSERIDKQLKKTFSWSGWITRFRGWFGGVSEGDMVLRNLIKAEIEEIFVVQQNSGLLLGSYSIHNTLDKEMIAGMLTAIKSFVKDAFVFGKQELETIEYENYELIIKNLESFYIVVVASGVVDEAFKNDLDDVLLDFSEVVLKKYHREKDFDQIQMTNLIKEYSEKLNGSS